MAMWPSLSRIAESQIDWMAERSWETISRVVPALRKLRMRSKL